MATASIKQDLVFNTYTATTGNSTYQGYYYGDVSIADKINAYSPVGFTVQDVTSNRPAFVIRNGSDIRVFSTASGTTIQVRVLWKKD